MDEYEGIEEAARHRDWQACAKLMFRLLYRCTTEGQRNVAKAALCTYVKTWNMKHGDVMRAIPERLLAYETEGKRPPLPDFPEDLDPADAEFENGLIEFYNGAYFNAPHPRHTMHFATAIRSAVTARQIERWLRDHPDDYAKWKSGRGIDGPTFLDDEAAAKEALTAWKFVADLLKVQPIAVYELWQSTKRIERSYKHWEDTVL